MNEYQLDPNVCPSSLGEDGFPMTEGETGHKWHGNVCSECGAEKEKADFNCPLCGSNEVSHEQVGETHIYVCDPCPFVGFEFHNEGNLKDLTTRLTQN